ncbi:hypothetical protein [Actinospica sp.]|uniref:PIN-like domain-containing protein n=1 Tax=Actinospica sp. TaxID=1872142 RepID=UPI002C70C26C|nr:hypothetical protein [Actinospica sp.]HWG27239.1 hypothetical protein [Actinospica sp.]
MSPSAPHSGHPEGLPHLFLDRSLGRIQVPGLLRAGGLDLTTLAEHYGIPADESVADQEWLYMAGAAGWAVLMKDDRIRRRGEERAALRDAGVRAFVLTSGNFRAAEMAQRFLDNVGRMVAACADPGPFLYAVHAHQISRLSIG